MTIRPDSRYVDSELFRVVLPNDSSNIMVWPAQVVLDDLNFIMRQAVQGDTFDRLSTELYGSPVYWWVLADANPEIIWPEDIQPGLMLRIPNTPTDFVTVINNETEDIRRG